MGRRHEIIVNDGNVMRACKVIKIGGGLHPTVGLVIGR